MSDPVQRPVRRRAGPIRPSATLGLVWFAALLVFYSLLLILPEMLDALAELPPDADPVEAGELVARPIAGPRLGLAFALAALTLVVGARLQVLPGLRRDP